jgi:hypothetical protein
MKKFYILIIALLPAALLLMFPTGGPSAGLTGSPLDGQDCTGCHTPGPATIVNGWISTDIPPIGYTPGDTYSITLSTPGSNTSKMGFQITAETTGAKAGTWIITNASRTQLKPDAVTHTAAGTDPIGTPNSWTMDWTAPPPGTGMLTFYAVVNASNANNSTSGDLIYVTSLEVNESNVGIAENLQEAVSELYPNPAKEKVRIDLPEGSDVRVYDNNGREVLSKTAETATVALDLGKLEKGTYFVMISLDGQQCTRKLVKW